MSMIFSSPIKQRLSSRRRLDIPFAVMGLFFIAMAISEYLFPTWAGGDRLEVKLLNGAQAAFALIVVFFTPGPPFFSRRIPFSFLLLFFWVCVSGIINAGDLMKVLYHLVMFLYWYSLFLFFYIRSRTNPEGVQVFLVLAACSLFVWVPTLIECTAGFMDIGHRPLWLQLQNYLGYYIVALFPYVLLLKRKTLKIISIALISYGAIYSLKRGAVLALVLMGIGSSLLYCTVLCSAGKRVRSVAIIIFLWAIVIAVGSQFVMAKQEDISHRILSNTGRPAIYVATVDAIEKGSFFELLAGHGIRQSRVVTGHDAHNDWLLLLYDYGIIGVVLMLNVYISLVGFLWKLCKLKSPLALPLTSSLLFMACVQLYSTGLYLKTFGFITGSIGLVLGCFYAENISEQSPGVFSRPTQKGSYSHNALK